MFRRNDFLGLSRNLSTEYSILPPQELLSFDRFDTKIMSNSRNVSSLVKFKLFRRIFDFSLNFVFSLDFFCNHL